MRKTDLETAARILGISVDAVRKRIKRGKLEAEKDESGRWRVLLPDEIPDDVHNIVDILRRENEFLKAELERKDHILMALAQKIPQLEAPKEQDRQPWWKRIFGIGNK